jgi:hypothetical protein
MPTRSTENETEDLKDTRPMMLAMAISQVTIAITVVVFVVYKIIICGCNCG